MSAKEKKKPSEKSKKKIYAFNLSRDNIVKLENKIGYNSKSKIIDGLILKFVNNKSESLPKQGPKPHEKGELIRGCKLV